MSKDILIDTLYDFLLKRNKSYYAQIMWISGCVCFVDKQPNEDYTDFDYTFKDGFGR